MKVTTKVVCLIVAVIALLDVIHAKQVVLGQKDGESITMSYLEPQGDDEAMRVRFAINKDKNLGYKRAATAICVNTNKDHKLQSGQKGFALSYTCNVKSGCETGTSLNYLFFGGQLKKANPPTWGATNDDLSITNLGSVNAGSGTEFSTRYALNKEELAKSNLPKVGEESNLKCFTSYDHDIEDVKIWQDTDLDTDDFKEADNKFKIDEDDLGEDEESEDAKGNKDDKENDDEDGAFQQFINIGILSLLVAFFTIF